VRRNRVVESARTPARNYPATRPHMGRRQTSGRQYVSAGLGGSTGRHRRKSGRQHRRLAGAFVEVPCESGGARLGRVQRTVRCW